jgi:ABC-type multidrug transport system ATPase subunit
MFARLGFAVAAHTYPQVLLVDEVLSVGDLGFQRKCFDKMHTFKSDGTTVIFVSHNLQAVSSLCDRVLFLRKGNVECIGKCDEVISKYVESVDSASQGDDCGIIADRVVLKDSNGVEKYIYESGEAICFDCSLLFTKEYKDLLVAILFHTEMQTLAFATDSMRLSSKAFSVSSGQRVSFGTKLILNLGPGRYEVRVSVLDRKTNRDILYYLFSHIVIKQNPRYGGIAFMNPQLTHFEIE